MKIEYEKDKHGMLETICPFDIFRKRKVGSARCSKCRYCDLMDTNQRIVICSHP